MAAISCSACSNSSPPTWPNPNTSPWGVALGSARYLSKPATSNAQGPKVFHNGTLADVGIQVGGNVESGVGPRALQHWCQRVGHRRHLLVAPYVLFLSFAEVAVEGTVGDEVAQSSLVDIGRGPVDVHPHRGQRSDQMGRSDHITETQTRRQSLGKRSDVHHASGPIQPIKRLEGPVDVSELRVVVVFDDQHLLGGGQFEQLESSFQAHGDPDGELVRRCDIDHPSISRDLVDDDAVSVHWHRSHFDVERPQQFPELVISRVFHGDRFAFCDECSGDHVEGLLCPGRDQDIIWAGIDSSGATDTARQRTAQVDVAGWVAI